MFHEGYPDFIHKNNKNSVIFLQETFPNEFSSGDGKAAHKDFGHFYGKLISPLVLYFHQFVCIFNSMSYTEYNSNNMLSER